MKEIRKPNGMILLTGPTGSGKTTTLYAALSRIDSSTTNVMTVEDPVEYVYQSQASLVTQRQLGLDTDSFPNGSKYALRQDPDVILVGEMRDLETMETAITAAETGHLVFSTLHTTGAARTVDRIIDAFPGNLQDQIRTQLSTSLIGV